jgi:hypothetical protein
MILHPNQQIISDDTHRMRVLIAGRRFGKSFLAMNEVAKIARYSNKRIFLIYPTYRQAKQVIWDEFRNRLAEKRWLKKVNETDLTFHLKNNTKISLRGADNEDSLRGVSLDYVVFDEFAMISESAWTDVIRPALSDREGGALFITTPMGQSNWAYDLYLRGQDPTETQWRSWSMRTIDGGRVSEEEIEQAQRDLDARSFEQEYLATFVTYSNRVHYSFDREHNVQVYNGPTPSLLYVGLDFNVGQMSATIFLRQGDTVHAIDEISLYSSNTFEICDELKNRYPNQRLWVYPDPSGSARRSSATTGQTDHTILRNAGFVVKAPNSHNPVRDGINAVNSKLCSASGQRTLFFDPKCKKSIESMEKHTYKMNSSIPDKDTGFDHFSDCIRYFIDYEFPITRERQPDPYAPKRWQHKIAA